MISAERKTSHCKHCTPTNAADLHAVSQEQALHRGTSFTTNRVCVCVPGRKYTRGSEAKVTIIIPDSL